MMFAITLAVAIGLPLIVAGLAGTATYVAMLVMFAPAGRGDADRAK
jgi:hypothetical protein